MDIKQQIKENGGRFYIEENNDSKAELDFELHDKNFLLIKHTEVDKSHAGKGIGKQLVSAAVKYARDNSIKIKATCSFAKALLDKTIEFADVYIAENKS